MRRYIADILRSIADYIDKPKHAVLIVNIDQNKRIADFNQLLGQYSQLLNKE